MRFLIFWLFSLVALVSGAEPQWSSTPPKMDLGTSYVSLPSLNQPLQSTLAQPGKVASLPSTTLQTETLPAQQGDLLATQSLPVIRTVTSETLPTQTLAPLQATYMAPNYRQQLINQEVIQPIVRTQPVLQVRHITQNVYQPTLQKQPVVQKVITQPILHRVIHNQPIIRQQLQQQTVVKRRVINQPQVVQQLQTMYQTAPQQTQQEFGAAYPAQTIPNAKVAQLMGGAGAQQQPQNGGDNNEEGGMMGGQEGEGGNEMMGGEGGEGGEGDMGGEGGEGGNGAFF